MTIIKPHNICVFLTDVTIVMSPCDRHSCLRATSLVTRQAESVFTNYHDPFAHELKQQSVQPNSTALCLCNSGPALLAVMHTIYVIF